MNKDERRALLRHAACVIASLADTVDSHGGTFQYVDKYATDEDGHRVDGGSVATASRAFLYRLALEADLTGRNE